MPGEVTNGGEATAGLEATDRDHHGDLSTQLLEPRDRAGALQPDDDPALLAGGIGVSNDGVVASHAVIVSIHNETASPVRFGKSRHIYVKMGRNMATI